MVKAKSLFGICFSTAVGGDTFEYERLLTTSNDECDLFRTTPDIGNNGSLLTYSITNDAVNNKVYFKFTSGTTNYGCVYTDSFDLHSDINFYIQNDDGDIFNEISRINSFDIFKRLICKDLMILTI